MPRTPPPRPPRPPQIDTLLLSAKAELQSANCRKTAELLDLLCKKVRSAGSLGRMAMLKSIEAELTTAMKDYVGVLLYAKRKVTGSGTAKDMMTVLEVSLVIAAAVCTGGTAGVVLGAAATAVHAARTNQNIVSGAQAVTSGISGSDDINLSQRQKTRFAISNASLEQSGSLANIATSRFSGIKKFYDEQKAKYDFRKINIGQTPYTLTQVKRKSTAWVHHGAGGTFAIEHDFATAIGLAYREFLIELQTNNRETIQLVKDSEENQKAFETHKITKHILYKACSKYKLDYAKSAYASLMEKRGRQRFGYNGGTAKIKVSKAIDVLISNSADLNRNTEEVIKQAKIAIDRQQ